MTTTPTTTTETADERFSAIDRLPTRELAELINREDAGVADAVATQLDPITRTVDAVTERLRRGGRLVYAGAGTAGRLGVLDASECPPTFNTDPELVVGLIAGGRSALVTAIEGAEDDRSLARTDIADLGITADDAVIGISASGRTPYAVEAVTAAREIGAFSAGISCNTETA
ncbi:MAG TPA: N-acetylmuramic acid 6-phosphate etherase, partial [Candidatus Janibacter merdipullorum]|nr:N-acetylmuramic acid 6-phosphate etherase [Candidatus Janibacter merdipullorum]